MREVRVKFGETGMYLHWPWPVTDEHRRRMTANHDRIVQAMWGAGAVRSRLNTERR